MIISDMIAKMIEEMLEEGNGSLEIQRNEFAGKLGCVPSQINYVITSRFTPERGYITESRRGGGGYIRIIKKQMGKDEYLMHYFCSIGDSLDERSGAAYIRALSDNGIITDREKVIIGAAMAAAPDNSIRADVLRHIILALMK